MDPGSAPPRWVTHSQWPPSRGRLTLATAVASYLHCLVRHLGTAHALQWREHIPRLLLRGIRIAEDHWREFVPKWWNIDMHHNVAMALRGTRRPAPGNGVPRPSLLEPLAGPRDAAWTRDAMLLENAFFTVLVPLVLAAKVDATQGLLFSGDLLDEMRQGLDPVLPRDIRRYLALRFTGNFRTIVDRVLARCLHDDVWAGVDWWRRGTLAGSGQV
ncbi:hypothetical protein Q8F55_006562 [Vanrija albida]|uniref:Uncharacterized protein n=1 Tax=Vanrija albida TaxID=181172 RepID=A0ABR3PYE8_9TREE